ARSYHLQDSLKISLLCPADKWQWVVDTAFLVAIIITTRAIRAGHLEGEFLLIKICPADIQAYNADQNDAATLAAHFCRLCYDLICFGRSRNDHGICTYIICCIGHKFYYINPGSGI